MGKGCGDHLGDADMTSKDFFNKVANGKEDFLQLFLDVLKQKKLSFCVIGGLGVNAYAEPLVSLDLDVVIIAEKIKTLIPVLKKKFKVEVFIHSINISHKNSALRIQIQTDKRYQDFLKRSKKKDVLGYKIPVAAIQDVFQGKVWAAMDETRRPSKRQKDLADILRLVEVRGSLKVLLPMDLRRQLRVN